MSRKIAFYFFLLLFLIHFHMTTYALERDVHSSKSSISTFGPLLGMFL